MDALDLLFRRIVLAAKAQGSPDRAITVGEILDTLAPYAAAKRDGALDTHDDYLAVVMELCSGNGSFTFGDDLMQDDLKAELETPNPDLSVMRTYAQTKLRLNTAKVQEVLAGDTEIDLRPPTPMNPRRASAEMPARTTGNNPAQTAPRGSTSIAEPGTMARGPLGSPEPIVEPGTEPLGGRVLQQAFDAYAGSQEGDSAPSGTGNLGCPYCAQALPTGRTVKFCPSCGQNLLVRRCPGCSAEIESGWKFCVTCGRKA